MKRYGEAEKAMEQVLKLDPLCEEAPSKLLTCRILQLTVRDTCCPRVALQVEPTSPPESFWLPVYARTLGAGF